MNLVIAFGLGLAIGAILAAAHLPVAAPPTLAGVLIVAGISFGYWIVGLAK